MNYIEQPLKKIAMSRKTLVVGLVLFGIALSSDNRIWGQHLATFRLEIGTSVPDESPVFFDVPENLSSIQELRLATRDRSIPVQWFNREKRQAVFLLPALPINDLKQSFHLEKEPASAGTDANDSTAVRLQTAPDSGDLKVAIDGKPVLGYASSIHQPGEGIEAFYARSGHIYPLMTPNGKVITSEFPKGHVHQHSIFNAWVNTTFQGHAVDFWNQQNRTGNVEHVRVLRTSSGKVFAEFVVEQRHLDLTNPATPVPVLQEVWAVRVWNRKDGYLFDIESRQTCVAESPLTINEYNYGCMGFRGNDQWLGQVGSDFLTSEGKTRIDGNHSRPNWTIAHGTVDNGPCYVAIMGYPSNFRHPEPVRLHPNMPYFVYSPPVLGAFELAPGKEHVARYRFYIADGKPDRDKVQAVWQALSAPIKVVYESK